MIPLLLLQTTNTVTRMFLLQTVLFLGLIFLFLSELQQRLPAEFLLEILCSALQTGQRNGSLAATQRNDYEKEGNAAVFWSDSEKGHIAHHFPVFFLPMSSLSTTRLMKSEQGWHSRGTSETATFSALRKHGLLGRRYPGRCSQRVSPRIARTETNISLVRRVAGAYAS